MGHKMKISLLIPIGSMSQRRPKRDFKDGCYYLNRPLYKPQLCLHHAVKINILKIFRIYK